VSPWYDTHVHLDRYDALERKALADRAMEAGVRLVSVAVDLASSQVVVATEGAWAKCVGIHPNRATDAIDERLRRLAMFPGVRAIGECGFDDDGPDWAVQRAVLQYQCELARDLGLTLVLHINGPGAWEKLVENAALFHSLSIIRHYFTGDAAQAAWHRERGHFLSFGNPLRRDDHLKAIARDYPAGLLLIETDSYPVPGRTTEPANVVLIGETLALLRGWSIPEAREQLERNTRSAFRTLNAGTTSPPGT
jgi:TatD DNase family protein